MVNFGSRIKNLRLNKKVLQKDIADCLGISVRAYQYYETNSRFPDFQGLIKLADYYQVSIDYLTCRTDNPEINK